MAAHQHHKACTTKTSGVFVMSRAVDPEVAVSCEVAVRVIACLGWSCHDVRCPHSGLPWSSPLHLTYQTHFLPKPHKLRRPILCSQMPRGQCGPLHASLSAAPPLNSKRCQCSQRLTIATAHHCQKSIAAAPLATNNKIRQPPCFRDGRTHGGSCACKFWPAWQQCVWSPEVIPN